MKVNKIYLCGLISFCILISSIALFSQSYEKAPITYSVVQSYINGNCKLVAKLNDRVAEKGAFKIGFKEIGNIYNLGFPQQHDKIKTVTYRKNGEILLFSGRGFGTHSGPAIIEGQTGEYFSFFWKTDKEKTMIHLIVKDTNSNLIVTSTLYQSCQI